MSQPPANFARSPFDAIRHEDDQGEWWSARELGTLLGYKTNYRNFTAAIERAKIACEGSGNVVSDHFAETRNMVTVGSGAKRTVDDYRLTRYACYLVAQNADPTKEIVAQAQTYFATQTRAAEIQAIERELAELATMLEGDPVAEATQRIILRQELSEANKELLRRAFEAGVITGEQFAFFMNMGYRGYYDGRTEDDMHAHRGLKPNQKISDYMGALETFGNYMRAVLGARNMHVRRVDNPHAAGIAHFDAGKTMRDVIIQLTGIAPEDLPRPKKSYRQIVKEEAARIAREEEEERGLWGHLLDEETDS